MSFATGRTEFAVIERCHGKARHYRYSWGEIYRRSVSSAWQGPGKCNAQASEYPEAARGPHGIA